DILCEIATECLLDLSLLGFVLQLARPGCAYNDAIRAHRNRKQVEGNTPVLHRADSVSFALHTATTKCYERDRSEVSDTTHYCRVVFQHGSGSPETIEL